MTRVLLTGCGGPASIGVARSLRKTGDHYLVGTDCNLLTLPFAETDVRYLVPRADDVRYIAVLNRIIEEERVDFVHAQPDPEVAELSRYRDRIRARLFLPARETVEICQNKYETFLKWRSAGLKVPTTDLLRTEADLRAAFASLGKPFWIRAITGAAGRGSFIVRDLDAAVSWVESWHGWGQFVASELLPGRLVTWQSLWKDGELVCAQGRERLAWAMGNRTPSGVTGVTGIGKTIARADLDEIAQRAILAIDDRPHGIFGVDLKEDAAGVPCPTEINIGRFFTTIQFFAELGMNFPDMYVRLAMGENASPPQKLNPLPSDVYWIRSMDAEPRLLREADIQALVKTVGAGPQTFDVQPDSTVRYE